MNRILITGALGQIGSELTPKLREKFGKENVIATDVREPKAPQDGPFDKLDVLKLDEMKRLVKEYDVDTVYHLAAILSATGEQKPDLAWRINIEGLINVLNTARDLKLTRVFHPSSIAAFGPETPRVLTPQETILKPRTMYGVTKVAGELLDNYYFEKFGVDVRGARLPGIISNVAPPGGGTTDYAVEIFYEAIKQKSYTCFLSEDTVLPMMYMPDCLKAFITLMDAEPSSLNHHGDYNLASLSFNPRELAAEIRRHIPEFTVKYKPDYRQAIADSWPKSIDDSASREEWGWRPDYDLPMMVEDMLRVLGERHERGDL
ncbi:NAD-dependent epimerase/dehydratase family protein [Candidatus Bathyarchaeota archaeon]|nr:NAD-dependent epimerase/dehydratase family protein [Candidatus Bathyarchaeota archaeon]